MKFFLSIITTLILLTMNVGLYAETDLPYTQEGMINDLNLEANQIVVSDSAINVSPYVEVNTSRGKRLGVEYLNSNMPIGYNIKGDTITEVWVLDRNPIDHSVNDD